MSDDRPVPLDYRPPIADTRASHRIPGWGRGGILTGAALSAVGMPALLTAAALSRESGILVVAALPLFFFSLGFWPAITVLSLRDRWRPSSAMTRATGACLLFALGASMTTITWFGVGEAGLAIDLLDALLLASAVFWTADLVSVRKPPAWLGLPILLVGLVCGVPVSTCPHATRVLVFGYDITLQGIACGNGTHWTPWWLLFLED